MTKINVDFGNADEVPNGVLLLEVTKIEPAVSQSDNKMLNVQMKIMKDPSDSFEGRMVFGSWMLETAAVFKTRQALKAFLGVNVSHETEIDTDDLIGKRAWCRVEVEKGQGEYEGSDRSRVKRYGVKPPVDEDTIDSLLK